MLALGELQKGAGPDQRVTARADVVDGTGTNARLTGVWKSWEIKTSTQPAEFAKTARDAKFLGWLVSGPDPAVTARIDFAKQAATDPVTLWGKGSVGDQAPENQQVSASVVPVGATTGGTTGACAWAVLDEGIKVRINTHYVDNASNNGMRTAQLGAGERPGVEFIPGLNALERKFFKQNAAQSRVIDNGITRLNFALTGEALAQGKGVKEALRPLTHDVTTQSLGLFTDTARGGFRQDFQLLMNSATLPAASPTPDLPYLGKGVYASRLGMAPATAPTDPPWTTLHQFARMYRDTPPNTYPANVINEGGVPKIKAQIPTGWVAATTDASNFVTINRTPPPGLVLLPSIAKVQMLFSLIGRDLYGDLPEDVTGPLTDAQKAIGIHYPLYISCRGTRNDYDLHLLYAPIVTLHNPYNVALELSNVRVEFVHIPFAMQLFRNGTALSSGLVPMETMYWDNQDGSNNRIFSMSLKNATADGTPDTSANATKITLLPGEVKLFSSYIDPNRSYYKELWDVYHNGGYGSVKFWDFTAGTNITTRIDALQGWRGDGIGFDCDMITGGVVAMAYDDEFHVLFAPLSVPSSKNKFVVQMSATVGSSSTPTIVSAIEMDYEAPDGLRNFIGSNGATMPMRYPKASAVPNTVKGIDLVDRAIKPIKDLVRVKPFALLSVQAKTTAGGEATMEDGRLATKPWCFAHANVAASTQKVLSEHSANFAHEIDMQVLDQGSDLLIEVDRAGQGRGNFVSGHTSTNGTKFGIQYEIPLAPLQTLAALNGANPGGSTSYLPRFAQPIGNSWAHPLIPSNKLIELNTNTNLNGGKNYLDHSFLLNLALYDGFYFSGLADQTGPFCTPAKTTATLAAEFAAGKPLDDPRLVLRPPDNRLATEFPEVVAKTTGATLPYQIVAAWQMMQGAFNVNSTSVPAWKAMLASIHDAQALCNQIDKANNSTSLSALAAEDKQARISRFRLPASKSFAAGASAKDGYWLGPREYSDSELQSLAESIVKQVRLRGPFLSLAEFVNRRLGTDETAQRGALQQAIDDSGINSAIAKAAGAGFEIPAATVAGYKYANAAAGAGSSYQGAPGFLTQADVLNVLGNAATARSDTFTIRGYGEARGAHGEILARATCEAVVQRFPEWLDPADTVETAVKDLKSQSNKTFGRRFLITSLRWLNPKEI